MKCSSYKKGITALGTLFIIAVIFVGIGTYLVVQNYKSPNDTNIAINSENSSFVEGQGTVRDIVSNLHPLKCVMSGSADGVQVHYIMYVADNRSYVETDSTTDGQTVSSKAIFDKNIMYSWTGNFGVKINIPSVNTNISQQNTTGNNISANQMPIQLDQEVQYKCQPWVVNEQFFVPPSSVRFIEV